MHIVTLSFDDGFLKSNVKIAEIYEKCDLSACFNVIATGSHESFVSPDSGHADHPKGDFKLWNELQARGHEIMPHGYKHAKKSTLPLEQAQRLIADCLNIFESELESFNPHRSIFNFPYNASTPELEDWLPTVVRAFRTAGGGLNPLPSRDTKKITTTGYGPKNCEHHLDEQIQELLSVPSGWLVYNTHGLDVEGWGPIGADYLEDLLQRLISIETVMVLPTGKVLDRYC